MSPLFQAKIQHNERYVLYDIFRTGDEDYLAKHVIDGNRNDYGDLPAEITIRKTSGIWKTIGSSDHYICSTLGLEIDVFNQGYGALLGRIGQ